MTAGGPDKAIFETLVRVGSTENPHPPLPLDNALRSTVSDDSSINTQVETPDADPEKGVPGTTAKPAGDDKDPDIVDWDGPDDPEKPINWSSRKKWTNMMVIAALTLLTPFGSSMFAPGVPEMMDDFHSTSVDLATFVVTIYVLGYAIGPLVIAPLSELYGRIPVYHTCTALFLVFTIACGVAPNMASIVVFRLLAGLAGSCPLTIGSGTIADCFKQEERGKVMSVWTLPILLGPTLGPVVGGYLSKYAGWRWNFYLLAIWTGIMLVLCFFLMPETYPPVLLQRKAARLRKATGNQNLRAPRSGPQRTPSQLLLQNIVRPTKLLTRSPIVFLLSLYIAVVYGYMYVMFATMTEVFEDVYGIGSANVGLTFLGLGVGQFLGLFIFGMLSDRDLKARAAKNGGVMKPEFRLPILVWMGFWTPAGMLLFGWGAQYKVHWIVPIIGTSMVALGNMCTFLPIGTYLVDAFTRYAASAMAANTVLRSLGGALLPLSARPLFQSLGYGWGNTLLGFVALAFVPIVFFLVKYAERIRTNPRFQVKLD